MNCRKSVADLSPAEKQEFTNAVLALKNPRLAPGRIPAAATSVKAGGGEPNRYDDYVWIHNQIGRGAHRGSAFAPWHREFLHQFEFDLQQVSHNPHLTIPYWDWTKDQTPFSMGWPFTDDFMGGFGNAITGKIATGPFASETAFRINIRGAGDTDLMLKRSRGVPTAKDLPPHATVLAAFGIDLAPGLPWPQVYDVTPFNGDPPGTGPTLDAQVATSFRKYLEYLLHDGIHGWVGGTWDFVGTGPRNGGHMSFPSVSVNDPIFWLHHCNVDRLWAIWQRKSPSPAYIPVAAGTAAAGHNGVDIMRAFDTQAHFNTILHQHPVDVLQHTALGYGYQSDLPTVTLTTPLVDFRDVLELTERPVQFDVQTCQPVTFTIVSLQGDAFSIPIGQTPLTITYDPTTPTTTASLLVQCDPSLVASQTGVLTIEASIIDKDGYDTTSPGTRLTIGTWTVPLIAPEESIVLLHAAHHEPDPQPDEEVDHHDEDHDHTSPFPMFQRDTNGTIRLINPQDIERDTSNYGPTGDDDQLKR